MESIEILAVVESVSNEKGIEEGIIFGALVVGIWDADTNLFNAMFALIWTAIFLIVLFYTDKKSD